MRTDSILASTPPPVSPDAGQSRATDTTRQDQQRVAEAGAAGASTERRGEGVDTFVRSVEGNEEAPRPRDEPVESGTDPRTERALQAYREAERTQV